MQIQNSGWIFSKILNVILSISKYQPLRGGSYLPLPKILTNKKCCINIKNDDNECLKYCVLYYLNKDKIIKDPQRLYKYKPYLNQFDFSKISFPVSFKDIEKVEQIINCGINVFTFEKSATPQHKAGKEFLKNR